MPDLIRFAGMSSSPVPLPGPAPEATARKARMAWGWERHRNGRRRDWRWRGWNRRWRWGSAGLVRALVMAVRQALVRAPVAPADPARRRVLEEQRERAPARGGASISALGCAKDEDCIVAYGHSNKGCCFRGCGSAFNRDYVAAEPCVSANAMTDPVPTSCDTGCTAVPWFEVSASLRRGLPGGAVHLGDAIQSLRYRRRLRSRGGLRERARRVLLVPGDHDEARSRQRSMRRSERATEAQRVCTTPARFATRSAAPHNAPIRRCSSATRESAWGAEASPSNSSAEVIREVHVPAGVHDPDCRASVASSVTLGLGTRASFRRSGAAVGVAHREQPLDLEPERTQIGKSNDGVGGAGVRAERVGAAVEGPLRRRRLARRNGCREGPCRIRGCTKSGEGSAERAGRRELQSVPACSRRLPRPCTFARSASSRSARTRT